MKIFFNAKTYKCTIKANKEGEANLLKKKERDSTRVININLPPS